MFCDVLLSHLAGQLVGDLCDQGRNWQSVDHGIFTVASPNDIG